jgi:hypothetical protein
VTENTKEVRVIVVWHTTHMLTVPEDWTVPATLDGFPEEALEEMRADDPSAEIVDWF